MNVLLGDVVRQYYIDEVRQSMRDRIQLDYGINLNNSHNAHITRTWDTVQEWVSDACTSRLLCRCSNLFPR